MINTINTPDELIKTLNSIASIKKDETFSPNINQNISHNTWSGSIWRTYYRESRIKTVKYIQNIFEQTIEIIQTIQNNELKDKLKNSLQEAIVGLENLKLTYINDFETIGIIVTIINNINEKLSVTIEPITDHEIIENTQFFDAIKSKNYLFIEQYLYDGNEPNIKNTEYQNGLHLISQKCFYDKKIINLLLSFGINYQDKDIHDQTPLSYAINTGCSEAVIILEEHIRKKKLG